MDTERAQYGQDLAPSLDAAKRQLQHSKEQIELSKRLLDDSFKRHAVMRESLDRLKGFRVDARPSWDYPLAGNDAGAV